MRIYKLIGLISVMGLCACSEINLPEATHEYVDFSTVISESRATDVKFDNNDKIGVFAMVDNGYNKPGSLEDNPYAANVPYIYNGSKFTAMNEGIELINNNDKFFYYAIYPYSSNLSNKFEFECRKDQSDYSNYTLSDLMVSYTDYSSNEKSIELKFIHILSKVVVNLEYSGIEIYNFTLKNFFYKSDLDLYDGTITTINNKIADIVMCTNGSKSFKAVVPAQTIKKGTTFATISTNVGNYTVTASNDIKLGMGNLNNIYIRINTSRSNNSLQCE